MHSLYILYSSSADKFYVGSTSQAIEERIRKHNSNHNGFTGKTGDWVLVYHESFSELFAARKRELQIKVEKQNQNYKINPRGLGQLVQYIPIL